MWVILPGDPLPTVEPLGTADPSVPCYGITPTKIFAFHPQTFWRRASQVDEWMRRSQAILRLMIAQRVGLDNHIRELLPKAQRYDEIMEAVENDSLARDGLEMIEAGERRLKNG